MESIDGEPLITTAKACLVECGDRCGLKGVVRRWGKTVTTTPSKSTSEEKVKVRGMPVR
jgi:hypothetical protein